MIHTHTHTFLSLDFFSCFFFCFFVGVCRSICFHNWKSFLLLFLLHLLLDANRFLTIFNWFYTSKLFPPLWTRQTTTKIFQNQFRTHKNWLLLSSHNIFSFLFTYIQIVHKFCQLMCQIGIGQMIKEFDFKFLLFLSFCVSVLSCCGYAASHIKLSLQRKLLRKLWTNWMMDSPTHIHTPFTLSYTIPSKEPTKRKMIFGTIFPSLEFNPLYDYYTLLQMFRYHTMPNVTQSTLRPFANESLALRKKTQKYFRLIVWICQVSVKKNNCRQRNFCVKLCVSHAIEYMIWHHPICACVCLCVSHVVSHNWRANKWKKKTQNDGDSNDKKKINYIHVWNEIEVVVRYIYWVSAIQSKKTQTHSHIRTQSEQNECKRGKDTERQNQKYKLNEMVDMECECVCVSLSTYLIILCFFMSFACWIRQSDVLVRTPNEYSRTHTHYVLKKVVERIHTNVWTRHKT